MKLASFLLVLSVTLLFGVAQAFYSNDVVELTESNFDRLVVNDSSTWVVQYYAPWCIFSGRMVPEYKKLAKMLKGVIKVGSLSANGNSDLILKHGTSTFPEFRIFGANKNSPTKYEGPFTAEAIAKAAKAIDEKKA